MTWLEVELTETGLRHVQHMGGELVPHGRKKLLRKEIETSDIPLFARIFLDIGEDARVVAPAEMVDLICDMLRSRLDIYGAWASSVSSNSSEETNGTVGETP